MAQNNINININALDNAIKSLEDLRNKCANRKTQPPTLVGGGKTVNQIEAIANNFKTVNAHTETLIANTISFMNNLKGSFISSDQKAYQGYVKKV